MSQNNKGFGLVEFMLALFLGTCLLMLMVRHYLTMKQQSAATALVLDQAYDQQLITELIRTSIQQAGFTPCAPLRSLIAYDDSHHPLEGLVLNAGDNKALQISRMSEDFTIVREIISTTQLRVDAVVRDFNVGRKILIADCFQAEINTIQSIHREGKLGYLRLKNPLHNTYESTIYIGAWLQERFFIDKNQQDENALYYQWQHPEELSDEVKGLVVNVETLGVKRLVSIDFLLRDRKAWHIETAVRV